MQVWRDLAIEDRVDLFSAGTGFEGFAETRDQQPDRLSLGGCEIGEVQRVSSGDEREVSEVAGSLIGPMVGVDQSHLRRQRRPPLAGTPRRHRRRGSFACWIPFY